MKANHNVCELESKDSTAKVSDSIDICNMWNEILTEKRKNAGLSRYRLAQLMGVTESYLLKVERGLITPGIDKVENYLQQCGCRLEIVE